MSSTTGRGERSTSLEKVASVTVTGSFETETGIFVLHRPQIGVRPLSTFSSGTRLVTPQEGHRMSCVSDMMTSSHAPG
jgi:hypothetical protein